MLLAQDLQMKGCLEIVGEFPIGFAELLFQQNHTTSRLHVGWTGLHAS